MASEFRRKGVIVTGAGSGIGRATALAFAEEGADLVLVDINSEANRESLQLVEEIGATAVTVDCDLSREDQVEAMVDTAVKSFGAIQVAVNNAGVEQEVTPLVEQTVETYDRVMDTNVKGVWLCMKYELKHMLGRGQGAIVNTSAMSDSIGSAGMQFYVASKHAVLGLTRSVALEVVRQGVRVNAVAPGPVLTPMLIEHRKRNPELHEMAEAAHPFGRYAEPREIADAILYLASNRSSYLVGQSIKVDGGATVP
ncbi:MAG: SDR family oxidoreductase [Gammaproteobacteria bacterium]|nr:SDR family oxidoreductase [Gammaproteobacteria bacterium]MDE0366406.1 SDR family oxidoreductase [Gammaproteobacteria bacterium]